MNKLKNPFSFLGSWRARLVLLVLFFMLPMFGILLFSSNPSVHFILLGGFSVLALIGIWIGADYFLIRKIRILQETIAKISEGNLEARTGLLHGPGELSQLAGAFDRMAEALELREQQLRNAEEAKKASEMRLTNILQFSTEAIVSVDADCLIIIFNKGAERTFGYVSQEVIGKPLHVLLPEDKGMPSLLVESKVNSDSQPREEFFWKRKDGSVFPAEVSVSWMSENGQKILTIFLADITWRRQAFQEIQESRRALSTLLSNLPGMAYRLQQNERWSLELVSEGALELTGLAPDDLIHEKVLPFQQLIHPNDRERIWDERLQAVKEGHPYRLIYRIRHTSGKEKWVWEQGRSVSTANDQEPAMEGFIIDISERREAEQKVENQFRRLAALRAIDMAIIGLLELKPILTTLVDQVIAQLQVDAAAILLYNPTMHTFEYAAGMGFRSQVMLNLKVRLGEGFIGEAVLKRKLSFCPNKYESLESFSQNLTSGLASEEFIAFGAVPLIAKSETKGVLVVFHRSQLNVDLDWLDFLAALADQAAIAIENATLYEQSRRSNFELTLAYEETIEGWANALELRDQETEGHSRRVTEITLALAREMGIPDEELVHIRRGAILHDIGKMAIPDQILLKPGPLTAQEWKIMRQHPEYAYRLLSSIPFLSPAMDIPHYHHERWLGQGYPRGLREREIPLAARIFAVVDVWDALRTDRKYRSALPAQEVHQYLLDQSGKEFDPQVVEKFIGLMGKRPSLF